ncbi:hypothetical protein [Hymenobacter cheonanensis]|uniref:hypothetical protein n=1 Tax=Hymenobacter sp. CA2-7 TaxID=3063993 RepID=UPI00271378B1|nr:hypothetical protein [Hymenobacter sp. CA2-7]MDO7885375.1 hypothetical protein [Hymenobacter sp. CA2-7]
MLRFYISVQAIELVAVIVAGVSGFIEAHVWSPAYTYYLLLVLVVLDVLTNNLVEKQPFRAKKLAWRLVGYTALLAFAHGFGEHEKGLFFLTQLVLAPFVLIHLRRLIIAFGKLGLVDSDVADLLQRRITRQAEREEEPAAPAEAAPAGVASPEPVAATA